MEVWYYFKATLRAVWFALTGFLIAGYHLRQAEYKRKQADTRAYFKKEANKRLLVWTVQERRRIVKLLKSKIIPIKQRKNFTFYNYITSVVLNVDPTMTPQQCISGFYAYIHPYFLGYYEAYKIVRNLKRTVGSTNDPEMIGKAVLRQKTDIVQVAALSDAFARAEEVMNLKKEITIELRKKEAEYKKAKAEEEAKLDAKMLELDIKVTENTIQREKETLGRLKKGKKESAKDSKRKIADLNRRSS